MSCSASCRTKDERYITLYAEYNLQKRDCRRSRHGNDHWTYRYGSDGAGRNRRVPGESTLAETQGPLGLQRCGGRWPAADGAGRGIAADERSDAELHSGERDREAGWRDVLAVTREGEPDGACLHRPSER